MKSLLDPSFRYVASKDMKPDYLREKFREMREKQEREQVEARLHRVIKMKRTA